MKAKDFLKQVSKIESMIANKEAEKQQWKALAYGTGSKTDGDRVQSSGDQQKMERAIIRYVDIEREIDACIDNLIDTKRDVISTIEMLPSHEYDVLHKYYIQGLSMYEIAGDKNKTYSWVTTIHGRALKNLQRIIDERGASSAV